MRRLWTALAVMAAVNWYTLTAMAQSFEPYPTDRTVVQTTTAPYTPPGGWGYPAANTSAVTTTTWEPAETAAYAPAVNYAPAAPTVNYAPAVSYPPTTTYAPAVTFASAAVVAPVQPVVYAPAVAQNPARVWVKYTPTVARYPAAPAVAYAPVANDYLAAAAAAHPGKTVWVHPKVYVEGQPIRNLLRAITP